MQSIPADRPIIFAPDRNLGGYIKKLTGRENIVLWDGACHVHEEFSLEKLLQLKKEHPAAKVVVHPECRAYIVEVADFVGSTAAILDYCGRSGADEFIVVTESGILAEMKKRYPGKVVNDFRTPMLQPKVSEFLLFSSDADYTLRNKQTMLLLDRKSVV